MNTLGTIQTFSKIARILCRIVFICCLVGGIFCCVGIIGLAIIPEGMQIGDTTIRGLIEESAEGSLGTCYAAMAVGIVLCAAEAVLSRIAEAYFLHELAAGTPFTLEGAEELKRLGICTICIPIGANIVAAIIFGIFKAAMENVQSSDLSAFDSGSIGLGIMFLVMWLLCRYGAEMTAKERPVQEEKPEQET